MSLNNAHPPPQQGERNDRNSHYNLQHITQMGQADYSPNWLYSEPKPKLLDVGRQALIHHTKGARTGTVCPFLYK